MANSSPTDSAPLASPRATALLTGIAVALGLVQTLAFACSVARLRVDQPVAFCIVALSAAAGLLAAGWIRGAASEPSPERPDLPRWLAAVAVASAAGAYLVLWATAWFKPDFTFDGNVYHIPVIHFWAERGWVHWIAAPDFHLHSWADGIWNGIPKAGETAAFVLTRAAGLPRLVNALNLVFTPLAAPALFLLSRAAGAGPRAALVAAALFYLVPVNIAQGPTTFVDSAAAAANVASLAFTVLAWDALTRARIPWRLVPGFGCALGLVMGLKGSGPLLVALELALLAGLAITGSISPSPRRLRPLRLLAWLAAVLCCAVATGGFWSVRNTLRHHNPVYPIGFSIAGKTITTGYSPDEFVAGGNPGVKPGSENWSDARQLANAWLQGLGAWPRSIVRIYTPEGGLGYLWLLGCLPAGAALAVCVARRGGLLRRADADDSPDPVERMLVLFILVAALFIFTPTHHIARYTVWLYAIGLPVFVRAAQMAWTASSTGWRIPGRAWAVACVALFAFEACYALAWTATRTRQADAAWPPFTSHPRRAISSLGWHDPVGYNFPSLAGTVFDTLLAGDDPVAMGPVATPQWVLLGQLCQPPGHRPVRFLSEAAAASRTETVAFLGTHDIRYVIWDPWRHLPGVLPELADREERIAEWFCVYSFDAPPSETHPLTAP